MDYFEFTNVATHVFYVDGSIIDFVHPKTGKSAIFGNSLEEIKVKYSNAVLMEKETAYKAADDYAYTKYCEPPTKITEKEYWYMLGQLPPMHWRSEGNTESFKMIEFITGNLTTIYAKIDDQYYEFVDYATLTHDQIIAKCKSV